LLGTCIWIFPCRRINMNVFNKKRVTKGFTLMETMISLMILAVSTLSVLGISAYSAKVEKQSEARTAALNIARTQIDALLSVSQSNRTAVTHQDINVPADLLALMPSEDVTAKYSIIPVPGTKNLQTISVTVNWRNTTGSGPLSSITASRVVSTSLDLSWLSTDGWNNPTYDQLFYTPPPPPPPPTTSGGSTGGSTGTSGTSGSTSASTTGSSSSTTTTGGGTAGSSSTGSSASTGSSGGTSGGTSSGPIYTGFVIGGGSKWK
jgi:prepilin-type N-terminal cleavage/methylation domain-containing protein